MLDPGLGGNIRLLWNVRSESGTLNSSTSSVSDRYGGGWDRGREDHCRRNPPRILIPPNREDSMNNPVNSAVFRVLQDTTRHSHAQRWVGEGMLMSSVLSLHASHRTKSFAKEL